MKCLVIQTSPERTSAEPVTNEDGTPHVYATMAEARAELKANGYSYNRENQRYYIQGTEYRAYIIREDSDEYAEIIAEQAHEDAARSLIAAYAEAIGDSVTADDPESIAAHRVAREAIGYATATDDDRATVAAMVEAIAERTHAAEAIEDAREAWTGPDYYRIAYSDGGMDATNDGAIWYETAADLARDLRSAYESATDTHLPYAERIERPTYQRYELEAFLGDPDDYDADAIEAEATEYDPKTDRAMWTPEAVRDLWSICERHELYSYAPAEDEPEPDEITAYMRRQAFGDYSRADATTREEMEAAALKFAAQEQTRLVALWQEAGARQACARYEADEATARDLMNLQDAGAITAEDVASYYRRHGWTPRKYHRS